MTYATVDDLKAVIPGQDLALLTDQDGTVGVASDARLLSALQDASAEIDGYISKRVALPLADPPRMLMVVARDLALHRLYANLGRTTETQDKLRDGALAYLRQVAKGELSIGDETPGNEVEVSPGAVVIEGPDRTMTRDTLGGF